MKIIYADSLVALNAAVDYLLLLAAGKLCALPLRRWRMGLGALWGGAYALLAAVYPAFWGLWTVKLAAGAVCVLLAYGVERRTPRALAAFYAAAAAFGGVARFAASLRGEQAGAGTALSARVLLLSFAVCYAVIALIFRRVGARQGERMHEVALSRNGRTLRLRALEDSGNALTDPLTGDAVLVAEAAALAPLFTEPALLCLDAPEALARIEGAEGRGLRLLPCSCVAAPRALLLCFRPDSIAVDGKARRDLLVAVSPHRLSPEGRYEAIIKT
jgi:stage II sporulation protein GA (sporulation sigma-E factor processing peptidase)